MKTAQLVKYMHNTYLAMKVVFCNEFAKICKYLKKCGYNHYEISNYAISGYKSRHNINYWNNGIITNVSKS